MIALGITGTDTGVGKTVVGCALAAALVRRGARLGVLKPVETGVAGDDLASDAAQLSAAARNGDTLATVRPYMFELPLAPLAAARAARSQIEVERLDQAFAAVGRGRDAVLVEGAGGLLVPLTRDLDVARLFARWSLATVVVAANRLGVINHARLTVQAARNAGLAVAAVVFSDVAPAHADVSSAGNAVLFAELDPSVTVLTFPWIHNVGNWDVLARAAESSGLLAAVAPAWVGAPRDTAHVPTPP